MAGGAPTGNTNAAGSRGGEFIAMVRRLCIAEDWKRVRASAEKLLNEAAAGEQWAIQMLADRLDGKPSQPLTGADGESLTINLLHFADRATNAGR